MKAGRVISFITAVAFLGFGLYFLFNPEGLSLVGVELMNGSAHAEIMAIYGGMQTGLGLFLIYCTFSSAKRSVEAGLLAAGLTLSCVALSRISGILIHGTEGSLLYLFLGSEAAGGLFCLSAWAWLRKRVANL